MVSLGHKELNMFPEITLRHKAQDLTDDKPTLVQAMALGSQATSHYLNQCWPSYSIPYDITSNQWVKADPNTATGNKVTQIKRINFNIIQESENILITWQYYFQLRDLVSGHIWAGTTCVCMPGL